MTDLQLAARHSSASVIFGLYCRFILASHNVFYICFTFISTLSCKAASSCVSVLKLQTVHLFRQAVCYFLNPLTPRSDQYINSSNNFNTLSSKQVMRIKKIIKIDIHFVNSHCWHDYQSFSHDVYLDSDSASESEDDPLVFFFFFTFPFFFLFLPSTFFFFLAFLFALLSDCSGFSSRYNLVP